jgi:hypothetical protein
MKVISIAAAGVSLVLIALTLAPGSGDARPYVAIGSLACSAVALLTIVAGWRDRPASIAGASITAPAAPVTPVAPAAPPDRVAPVVPPARAVSAEVEIVSFLATLQEKGRLVDFLQDDIAGYSDAQVGAAARVVHAGCKAVLAEYLHIVPVRAEAEGAKITVPAGFAADEYRLVGRIGGSAPFSGTLMHRGWKAESVTLPRVLRADDSRLPAIAPAEVELR